MDKEKKKQIEYETVDVTVQCLNCYSVWRIEHDVEKGEKPALRAELLKCPLCYDESE